MTCAKSGYNDNGVRFQRRPSKGQGGNKIEEMSSNSWINTDSPKLLPRNKPQKTENQQTKTKITTKYGRGWSKEKNFDSENSTIENGVGEKSDPNATSSISTEKNSSDPTTIKVTDKCLLENSWRITETPNMPPPLNRQQSSEYGNFCCRVFTRMIFQSCIAGV